MADDAKPDAPAEPVAKRGPGRPRVAERGSRISTWLPTADVDRLMRVARRHDRTVSSLIRAVIVRRLDRVDPPS